jgi:hypothetical protein
MYMRRGGGERWVMEDRPVTIRWGTENMSLGIICILLNNTVIDSDYSVEG